MTLDLSLLAYGAHRPSEAMTGWVDATVARPAVQELAVEQFGQRALGTGRELQLSFAIYQDQLFARVFGDSVVVSRPELGWTERGPHAVSARLRWRQDERDLEFDYSGPEGRRQVRITGDGPLEGAGSPLPFESQWPDPALGDTASHQFLSLVLTWVWGMGGPGVRVIPAYTFLYEVRLAPLGAAEPGLVPVTLPPPGALADQLRGFSDRARVAEHGPLLTVDAGTGDTIRLLELEDGRALLLDYDEDDEVYFRGAAEYFGEYETDLCDHAPSWWSEAIAQHCPWVDDPDAAQWVSQLFAWDGKRWQRSDAGPDESGLRRLLQVLAADS